MGLNNLDMMAKVGWRDNNVFWTLVATLIGIKLYLVSGTAVQMVYSPHDDGLYVSRAFYWLTDGSLGPYDARLLVKELGISLWLGSMRALGIPYLLSINVLYALAGLYFICAMRRLTYGDAALVVIFGLFLFNPVSIDWQWFRVMREPLSISLLIIILSSMSFILIHLRNGLLAWCHFIVLSAAFSFSLSLREEDILLYALLLSFACVVIYLYITSRDTRTVKGYILLGVLVTLPISLAALQGSLMGLYVEKNYGVNLVNDFGGGEFPKLIASIRSVRVAKDNRHVMITQEALGRLRRVVPEFAPVIDRLPSPSANSYSCHRFQVCSEWTNGWMLFWIKDAAFQAGLTNSLLESQRYFKSIRNQIDVACENRKLDCLRKGDGLLPQFELRWTRAFVLELFNILSMMFNPKLGAVSPPPATYPVSVDYGQMYQAVTMSHHFDSLQQSRSGDNPWEDDLTTYHSLQYWLRYPDIAMNDYFGVKSDAMTGDELGAAVHFDRHGQYEGRIWDELKKDKAESNLVLSLPGIFWKKWLIEVYEKSGVFLIFLAFLCLVFRAFLPFKIIGNELLVIVFLFIAFTAVRLGAISYVSVYMGSLDVRLFFSSYVVFLLLGSVVIVDTCKVVGARFFDENITELSEG
jgi:hypothetical protein